MVEIARRSFLFGMGAALTTAALAKPMALLMPAPLPFKVKSIKSLTVCLDAAAKHPAIFSVGIGERRNILSGAIAPGGCYLWTPAFGESPIQLAGEVLHVDLDGNLAEARLASYNEHGVGIIETYKPGKPSTFEYLDTDHG